LEIGVTQASRSTQALLHAPHMPMLGVTQQHGLRDAAAG
jgi:hypothetical protein